MSTGKVVIGVLAGVAIGALLGVLLAPNKGSETRKKITKKSKDTVDDLQVQIEELLNSLNEKLELAKEEALEQYEKEKNIASNAVQGAVS